MAAVPAVSFFAQQERARSASRTLVVLYVLAVAAIVACVVFIVQPSPDGSAPRGTGHRKPARPNRRFRNSARSV